MGAEHIGFVSDLRQARPGRLLQYRPLEEWWQGRMSITWLSADGPRVLVESKGLDYTPQPLHAGASQVYLRDLRDPVEPSWTMISRSVSGNAANGDSGGAVASRDLSTIAFWSGATDLVAKDSNNCFDIFLFERSSGRTTRILAPAKR
jgi:hypothetical protein